MPQPLGQWIDGIYFHEKILKERPELATMIARIAAAWSMIEVDMGLALAVILDTDARTGVSMYVALSGSAAQDRALAAAVETCLPDSMHATFAELLKEFRKRGKERNRVVHALWSLHPNDEKKLINCAPENIVRDVAKAYNALFASDEPMIKSPTKQLVSELLVYTEADFRDIIERILAFRMKINAFSESAKEHHTSRSILARAKARPPPGAT
jgi:hypothetical protein